MSGNCPGALPDMPCDGSSLVVCTGWPDTICCRNYWAWTALYQASHGDKSDCDGVGDGAELNGPACMHINIQTMMTTIMTDSKGMGHHGHTGSHGGVSPRPWWTGGVDRVALSGWRTADGSTMKLILAPFARCRFATETDWQFIVFAQKCQVPSESRAESWAGRYSGSSNDICFALLAWQHTPVIGATFRVGIHGTIHGINKWPQWPK